MANNQQDTSQKLSPLRLLSDNSSEGLPSPDELKRIFFPKNSKAQLQSPLRHSSQTEVIILDDSPPIVEVKVKRKVDSINYDNDAGDCSSRELGGLENSKAIKNSAQKEAEKKRLKQIKEANAIRLVSTDKLHDTIICLESSLHDAEVGQAIQAQFQEKEAEILSVDHPVENTIQWRRKCLADWDTSSQSYIPNEEGRIKILQDKHIGIYLNMHRLVELITNNQLIPTLEQLQLKHNQCQIIIFIEGLQKYYRNRKNLQSRSFQSLVLRGIANTYTDDQRSASTSKKPRTNKSDQSEWLANGPDRNTLEDIMTMLQFEHRVMIIQTVDCAATASWVASVTANIATGGRESNEMLDFCMDGRIRSGADNTDTWLKMLQNIQQCTEAVAKAIVREYPTIYTLYEAYTRCESTADAEMLLADIEVPIFEN
ncbi:hypothetical protein NQZ79_g5087 [Umbelopsis isabellina]|nr:hypothetical protein NQZ79_g5087 [Umbelopsis isabellina]